MHEGPILHILAGSDYFLFLDHSHPNGVRWALLVFLICLSLGTHGAEHLFMCYWPFICLLWGNVCSSPLPIFLWVACLFIVEEILYIVWIQVPYQKYDLQMFSPIL